jgi:hypothetical protein
MAAVPDLDLGPIRRRSSATMQAVKAPAAASAEPRPGAPAPVAQAPAGPPPMGGGDMSFDDDLLSGDPINLELEVDPRQRTSAHGPAASQAADSPDAAAPGSSAGPQPPGTEGAQATRPSRAPGSARGSARPEALPVSAVGTTRHSNPPPPPKPRSEDPIHRLAAFGDPPTQIWQTPGYAIRVILRKRELQAEREERKTRAPAEVPLYDAALKSEDARGVSAGLVIIGVAVAIGVLVFFLPVIIRFARLAMD